MVDLGAKYQVIEELGAGAMGRVFKARQVLLKRIVAIKVINNDLVQSEESRLRFIREAQLSAQLSHPNIVQTYDVEHAIVDDAPLTYIVTEFIDGFPLGELLKKTPIPSIKTTVRLLAQLLDGLAHAHDKKVIHRDIKPDNLLVTRDGQIKIADFGIARTAEDNSTLTKEGVIIGTPLFLAPELIAPKPGQTVTKAVDLYATGVLLFRMLTGKYPFVANDAATLLHKHLNEKPLKPSMHNPDVPAHLSRLTMQLLAKDPHERPQSAKEIAAELRRPPRAGDLDASSNFTVVDKNQIADRGVTTTSAAELGHAAMTRATRQAVKTAQGGKQLAVQDQSPKVEQRKILWPLALVGLVIGLFLLHVFLSPKSPSFSKVKVVTKRNEPQVATLTWSSIKPYRAKFKASAINGKHQSTQEEKVTTNLHKIVFPNIQTKFDYRYVISAADTEIASGTILGKPATIDEVYVYKRREVADIDWVTKVPIENPRVVERKTNRKFLCKRSKILPDGRFLYSATVEQMQPAPKSYHFTGVTSSPVISGLECTNEVIAVTATRPTFEMRCLRQVDAQLSASDHRRLLESMSEKHRHKLRGEQDRIRARFDTGPIVTDDEILTSNKGGEVVAYEKPGPKSFRWPRPKVMMKERWVFRDCAVNYDGPSTMCVDGNKVMFLQNRHDLNINSKWWGIEDKVMSQKVDLLAREAVKSMIKGKDPLQFDNVYVLNRKKRYEEYQNLLKNKTREEILNISKYQDAIPAWSERSFKFLCPSSEATKPHVWFDGGIDWTFAPKVNRVYCRIYNQYPVPQDITAILDIGDPSANYCRLLVPDMDYVTQPPVVHDDYVYFLSIPERQRKLRKILRDNRPNFVRAFSTKFNEKWIYQIDNSIELSRMYYDKESRRLFLSSHRDIYVLDCYARSVFKKGKPKDFKISIEAARAAMARNDDILSQFGFCFASTPIAFASPDDRKQNKLFILISVGVETKNIEFHTGLMEECQTLGYVILEVNEKFEITRAIAVQNVGHKVDVDVGKAAGSTEHIVESDERSGLVVFAQNDHILVIDPLKSPPHHLVLETKDPAHETEFVAFDDNAVYFTIRRGKIMRASISPTRRN